MIDFKREPWAHQRQAFDRFKDMPRFALLHEMGTGKTTTAINILRHKYLQAKSIRRTLIISPVATLKNWYREIEMNASERVLCATAVVYGSAKRRVEILQDETKKIFITNPETLTMKSVVHAFGQVDYLILDESHMFKNPKSKRMQALLPIADACKTVGIMTGTPILNTYLDVWAQWRILDGGATFGKNFFVFREQYFYDKNARWKGKPNYFPDYQPKPECAEELSYKMDLLASRVKKSQCLTLPPLVTMREVVGLGPDQERVYRAMEEELVAEVKEGTCAATNALTRVLRLLQILSGHMPLDTGIKYLLKENPRLERLQELLEQLTPTHKVIVWCVFEHNYVMIQSLCEALNIGFAQLHGGTKDRQAEIDRFQSDPRCRVMISNPKAGGVGVNLTAASYSIYFSRTHSLGDRLQSEARNYRGGSEVHEKVTLIDLVAENTLDVDVLDALDRKENFSESVLARLLAK